MVTKASIRRLVPRKCHSSRLTLTQLNDTINTQKQTQRYQLLPQDTSIYLLFNNN